MPYYITLLSLVVTGVGFTLFQSGPVEADVISNTATTTKLVEEIANEFEALFTSTDNEETEAISFDTFPGNKTVTPTPSDSAVPGPTEPAPSTPITTPTPAPAIVNKNNYTNGTYSTTVSYRTPDGTYQMNVALTVVDDSVTGTSVAFDSRGARDGYSRRFSNSYQSQVVGKDLSNVQLSRVGGASLTTRAFNNAVSSIKSEAKS